MMFAPASPLRLNCSPRGKETANKQGNPAHLCDKEFHVVDREDSKPCPLAPASLDARYVRPSLPQLNQKVVPKESVLLPPCLEGTHNILTVVCSKERNEREHLKIWKEKVVMLVHVASRI